MCDSAGRFCPFCGIKWVYQLSASSIRAGNKINYFSCFSSYINIVQPKFQRGFKYRIQNRILKTSSPTTEKQVHCQKQTEYIYCASAPAMTEAQNLFFSHLKFVHQQINLHYRQIGGQIVPMRGPRLLALPSFCFRAVSPLQSFTKEDLRNVAHNTVSLVYVQHLIVL